jgi:soluble P-type ATPase
MASRVSASNGGNEEGENAMIALDISGLGAFQWLHLVLDLNGTLALDGVLIDGVAPRVRALARELNAHLLTADAHGTGAQVAKALGIAFHRLPSAPRTTASEAAPSEAAPLEAAQKERFVAALGAAGVIAIGNGNNDMGMLRAASLGIAVLGPEGAARAALEAADIVARDILEALDLLLHPRRIAATLRR